MRKWKPNARSISLTAIDRPIKIENWNDRSRIIIPASGGQRSARRLWFLHWWTKASYIWLVGNNWIAIPDYLRIGTRPLSQMLLVFILLLRGCRFSVELPVADQQQPTLFKFIQTFICISFSNNLLIILISRSERQWPMQIRRVSRGCGGWRARSVRQRFLYVRLRLFMLVERPLMLVHHRVAEAPYFF